MAKQIQTEIAPVTKAGKNEVHHKSISFRVFPGRTYYDGKLRGMFYWCHVFKNEADLQNFYEATKPESAIDVDQTHGVVMKYRNSRVNKAGKRRTSLEIGTILLCMDRIGTWYVSHESFHAALHWLDCMKMMPLFKQYTTAGEYYDKFGFKDTYWDCPEEILAFAIGDTSSQIYKMLEETDAVEWSKSGKKD